MRNQLKAGVSIIDISPKPNVELAGYPHCPRYNTGIHDPLFAGCIYICNGNKQLAFVAMDLLMLSKKYVKDIRDRAAQVTGIPAGDIVLCCSHTHSGPWASGRLDLESLEAEAKPDKAYMAELEEKIVLLIKNAYTSRFPARIGIDKGLCGGEKGVGGNRRDPKGISDPEVWVIGIQDLDGNWKACLVKYALHPTVIHAESTMVTADYPGYIRNRLSSEYPGIITLFAQGTSGDQSTRYFRKGQTFEESHRIGDSIGAEASEVLRSMVLSEKAVLNIQSMEISLPLRRMPIRTEAEEHVKNMASRLASLKDKQRPYIEIQNAELDLFGAENTLGYILQLEKKHKIDLIEDELPAEIQGIKINDTCIICLPGETFVEFGLAIQTNSPCERTFVIELSNGCLPGYVCTAQAYNEGGYEAGASILGRGAGARLVESALQILHKLDQ